MARRKPRAKPTRRQALTMRTARLAKFCPKTPPPPCSKFVPNADRAFKSMAEKFATKVAAESVTFNISERDSKMLTRRVKEFCDALSRATDSEATPSAVRGKNTARKVAEEWVRAIANQIRGDITIEQADKDRLGLYARSKKLAKRGCPGAVPALNFVCTIEPSNTTPGKHVVEFGDICDGRLGRKPDGAACLHLYFDLVPPGEPIPQHPAERGWPKFMREFTRSPMKVEFPVPMSGPMVVVYWGRWSDGKGNTGPWSAPCVARIEGTLDVRALPEAAREQRMVFIEPPRQLLGHVEGNDAAAKKANAVIAALFATGRPVLEAATVRLLNAA